MILQKLYQLMGSTKRYTVYNSKYILEKYRMIKEVERSLDLKTDNSTDNTKYST